MSKQVKELGVKDYAQKMIDQLQLLIDIADKDDYHIPGISICKCVKWDVTDLEDLIRKEMRL